MSCVHVAWQAWWASQHVPLLCLLQGDCFLSALSRSTLLLEADVLSVLDLSENAIGDSGAAALAATLAAAGAQGSGHAAVHHSRLQLTADGNSLFQALKSQIQAAVLFS
jgi:hypothetical protein